MKLIRIFSSLLLLMVLDTRLLGKNGYLGSQKAAAMEISQNIRLTVNSNADNNQRDNQLTLREAIAVTNGTLAINELTAAEASKISSNDQPTNRIEFNLLPQQNTIKLRQPLPPITKPGLVISAELSIVDDNCPPELSVCLVEGVRITPDTDAAPILRGLTIMADDITIQGLTLYGFTAEKAIGSTPSAEIFISGYLPEVFVGKEPPDLEKINSPKNIRIYNNNLGGYHENNLTKSTFGIWIFNGENILIKDNQITHHPGSGIISSLRSNNLQIENNLISDNGLAGMPDGIRLEGNVTGATITNNQISHNGGAGIFLFKPIGSVEIRENQIESNGQRFSRPGIYLMGHGHQVIDNQIRGQNGAGVVVSANPISDRNRIQGNQFSNLLGLSIDLNADNGRNSKVPRPYYGDGPNPESNSSNRRLDTGNSGINAPKFLASEFFIINGQLQIDGIADPDTVVEIYRVLEANNAYGPLSQPLVQVATDQQGRFNVALTDMEPGEIISAIATHPDHGTSEPARNAMIVISD